MGYGVARVSSLAIFLGVMKPAPMPEWLRKIVDEPEAVIPDSASVQELRNIGPKTTAWLEAVGLGTVGELRAAGLREAYYRIKAKGFPINAVWLYAIDAGLQNKDWLEQTDERKAELRALAAEVNRMFKQAKKKSTNG